MPKREQEFTQDPIPEEQEMPKKEQGMTEGEAQAVQNSRMLAQRNSELEQRIRRLEAIADQNKGKTYDENQKDKSKHHGFLRWVDDVMNPIVEWGSVSNVSYVDSTGAFVEDIRYWVQMLDGQRQEMTIHEWNRIRDHQTWIEISKFDRIADTADITISTDGGRTYLGQKLTIPTKFINPG